VTIAVQMGIEQGRRMAEWERLRGLGLLKKGTKHDG